ncbi:MAG TPA: metal ABC transporter permease [Candidatus Eisenbacteria bacterium]|nr:metal ABC transporter permease [Candidatus Eisenbacteria bacterium]
MDLLDEMFAHEFLRNALLASTGIALAAGLAGYFLVLRGQVFAADALSHVAFTGGVAALAFGVNELFGLLVATVLAAVLLNSLSVASRAGDTEIGILFALILGLGVLFISIYVSGHATSNSTGGVGVLFGSVFGISAGQARTAVFVSLGAVVSLLAIARPLLFASVDSAAAAAQGIRVGVLGGAFLLVVAVVASEAVQVTGALLILGLMATPAAVARNLTTRPYAGMALSAGIALVAAWSGLTLSYLVPTLPPSFAMMAVLFGLYLLSRGILTMQKARA